MSRVIRSRRSVTTNRGNDQVFQQPEIYKFSENIEHHRRKESCNDLQFDEMTKTRQGESVINLSEGVSTVNIDKHSLMKINDININPSNRPPGEEIYEDVFEVTSDYKNKMIQDMIKDVKNQTRYLYENDDKEYRGYEDQLMNPSVALSSATQRKNYEEAKSIVVKNNKKVNNKD